MMANTEKDKELEIARMQLMMALLAKDMDPTLAWKPSPASTSAPVTTPATNSTQGGVSRGRIVLQYEPTEPPRLLRTFDSARDAAASLEGKKYDYHIRAAVQGNYILEGYRWQMVERSRYPDDIPPLPPTEEPGAGHKAPENARVAQLDPATLAIITVHASQKDAAAAASVRQASSISLAITRKSVSGGYRWAWYDSVPEAARAAYDGPLPVAVRVRTSNRKVEQVDRNTGQVVRTFNTMSEACDLIHGCHKSVCQHIAAGTVYRGTLWRWGDAPKKKAPAQEDAVAASAAT